jgi:hypothetical protein
MMRCPQDQQQRPSGAGRAAAACAGTFLPAAAQAHAIGGKDAQFVRATTAPAPGPFIYLGAKHMVTGLDHVLFLLGVIFLLQRFRQIALYVSLFALGHSITLIAGVLLGVGIDARLVDAAIGVSVFYKAFDNLGGMQALFGQRVDPRAMVFGFGLVHGLGLATKLEELGLNPGGLIANLVSFNVGVELGQLAALGLLLPIVLMLRASRRSAAISIIGNMALMIAGVVLAGDQIARYLLGV